MKVYQKNTTDTDTLPVCLPHPPNAPNLEPAPFGSSVDILRYRQRLPGSKNVVYQSYSEQISDREYTTRITTVPLYHTEHRTIPLRTVCLMNCPVLLQCPDQFISNTKVVRNSSTNPDTQ